MQIRTNATKRDRNHTIDVTAEQLRYVRQKFKCVPRGFKSIDGGFILPGLKLHYKTFGGVVKVSFEEKNNGLAVEEDWYTKEQLVP